MIKPLSPQAYDSDVKRLSFYNHALEKISRFPGVRNAAFSSNPPFTAEGNTEGFRIEGRAATADDQFNDALYRESSSRYLQTLGAQLTSGRLLSDSDTSTSQPVIVINSTFPGAGSIAAH